MPDSTDPSSYVHGFVQAIITDAYTKSFGMTVQALQEALSLADQFINIEIETVPVSSRFTVSPASDLRREVVPRPEMPDTEFDSGALDEVPKAPELIGIEAPPLTDVPAFTGVAPDMTFPDKPGAFQRSAPTEPSLENVDASGRPQAPTFTEVSVPTPLPLNLPTLPTLRSIDIPATPTITLPTFAGVKPNTDLDPPDVTFRYVEPATDPRLFNAVYAKLTAFMNNGDSVPDWIESLLLDRGRASAEIAARKSAVEIDELYGRAGWGRSSGPRLQAQAKVISENRAAVMGVSRDLYIEIHQQRVQTRQAALAQAVQLTISLWAHEDALANRTLEVAKATVEATISLFNARISLINAELEAWVKEAEVFRDLLQAALAELEIWKAKLEGQKLIGTLNDQDIRAYTASLEGVKASVEIYNSQVAGVEAISRNNLARAQIFGSQVEAWAKGVEVPISINNSRTQIFAQSVQALLAEAQVNKTQWDGWATEIGGEVKKVDLFDASVRAYTALIEGIKARNEAVLATPRFKIDLQDAAIKVFSAQMERGKAGVQAESARITAASELFSAQARVYESDNQAENARLSALAEEKRLKLAEGSAASDTFLKSLEMQIQQILKAQELRITALGGGSTALAQIGAAAGNLFNFGANASSIASSSMSISSS